MAEVVEIAGGECTTDERPRDLVGLLLRAEKTNMHSRIIAARPKASNINWAGASNQPGTRTTPSKLSVPATHHRHSEALRMLQKIVATIMTIAIDMAENELRLIVHSPPEWIDDSAILQPSGS